MAMEEDLLGDLIGYRKDRDKGVMSAAGGLLQLYCEVNLNMLKRREQGKTARMRLTQGSQPTPFGYVEKPAEDIEGLTLLESRDHLKTGLSSAGSSAQPRPCFPCHDIRASGIDQPRDTTFDPFVSAFVSWYISHTSEAAF
ncbi:SDA1-domain-containing protein [Lactifluus volemus]|nr:SDA1-domain-containing protein [Lactifluus volemus]